MLLPPNLFATLQGWRFLCYGTTSLFCHFTELSPALYLGAYRKRAIAQ